ncbi:MAG: hypothetical protein M3P30_11105 [Chloroflexota bacterium]|nr:hypothetical protein [Chloroflexota bacterium]
MTFEGEADLLRLGARTDAATFLRRIKQAALGALESDLSDEALKAGPDDYILRANAIALGVADAGAPEIADQIYTELLTRVDRQKTEAGDRRHRGALLANRAWMNVMLRRYDIAIPFMQYVVLVEDPETYGVAPEDSFGNTIRRSQLDDPAIDVLSNVLSGVALHVDRKISRLELESCFSFLGESVHVLYGVILELKHNIDFALKASLGSSYTALRLFDAFRSYAFFLEELVGRLAVIEAGRRKLSEPSHFSGIELRQGLAYLFGRAGEERSWWSRLQAELKETRDRCRNKPVDVQNARLEELAERVPTSAEDTLVTSIGVLYVVRNLGAHEIYPPAYLVAPEIHLERVLAWLTTSAVLIQREYITPDGASVP